MKKLLKVFVVVIVLGGILAILRPDTSDFENYIRDRYKHKNEKAQGEHALDGLVDKGVTKVTELQIIATYEYENKWIAAWVTAEVGEKDFRYLGIAGKWIALSE
jgi:hypothetical protein